MKPRTLPDVDGNAFTQADAEQLEALFRKFYSAIGSKFGSYVAVVVSRSTYYPTGVSFGVQADGAQFSNSGTAWAALGGLLKRDPNDAKRQKLKDLESQVESLKSEISKEGDTL